MGLAGAARRWPSAAAALSYVGVAGAVLAPSVRPGRTLVAADLLSLVAPYDSLPGRPPIHNPLLSDIPFQFFPWLDFMADALRSGHVPSWNPFLLGGVPVTPNGFVSVYYPPFWLSRWLSPFDAYNAFVLLHLVIGALGVYALARVVGARPLPAWVAGLMVFTAAFWVHWSTHMVHLVGIVWLPWALAASHRLVVQPGRRRVATIAAVFGLWWLGSNPQYAYYGTLAMLAYAGALLVGRRMRRQGGFLRPGLALGAGLALGLALAAPVLLPTARISQGVVREREPEPPKAAVPKREAIESLVPEALGSPADGIYLGSDDELRMDSPFVGVTAVLLAVAALGGRRSAGRVLLVAGGAVVVVLAYTVVPHEALYRLVPGYDRFRGVSRWLAVLPVFALPLAGLGLQDVLRGDRRPRAVLVLACAAAALVIGTWYLRKGGDPAVHAFLARRALVAVTGVGLVALVAVLAGRWSRVAFAVVVVSVLGEIAFHTPRWYPSVREAGAYPDLALAQIANERGGRLIHVGGRTTFPPFAPNLPMLYGAADSQGLAVLFPRDYDRYLRLIDDYGGYARLLNAAPPLADPSMLGSPLLDALDVRTAVVPPDIRVPDAFPLLLSSSPSVYGRRSLGAAAVVPMAVPVGEAEMWRRVGEPGWDPAATAAVVGLRSPVQGGAGSVSGGPTAPGRERWLVDAPGGGFLRVSGSWDGGWSARVDGRPTRVLRADGIFRGVVVPAGHHEVRLSFRNPAEHRGRWVAAAALTVLLCLAAVPSRRRNNPRQS